VSAFSNQSFPQATLRRAIWSKSSTSTNAILLLSGVAFLAAMAQIAIKIPGSPVPVTGQTLGALLIGTAYGSGLGLTTLATYLVIGIAGAPVFTGGSAGLVHLTGATGGYLIGMLVSAAITGQLAARKWDQKIATALPSMLLGEMAIFAFGLAWLKIDLGKSWSWTIAAGLTPFILGEVIKIAIAASALPLLWRGIRR
jgi:biotin transport system substrate-specific component